VPDSRTYVALTAPSVQVVVAVDGGVPRIAYWGLPLPDDTDLAELDRATEPATPQGGLDRAPRLTLLPEQGRGSFAAPGIVGHRVGQPWSAVLATVRTERTPTGLTWAGADPTSGLDVQLVLDLDPSGVLSIAASVTNTGETDYTVERLAPTLTLPTSAQEVLTLAGRWSKEFQVQRQPLVTGAIVRENARGRTSHESSPTMFAGTTGFGETHGEVVGVHLAWSGNHLLRAERLPDGRGYVQAAELLQFGEVVLTPGETYASPTAHAVYSATGLTAASQVFHAFVRSMPGHPTAPRKVLLNTWEAVYFDHDVAGLKQLADRAAEIGVERFVLDDGWFRGRDDDTTSLGDWYVDERKYPDGLGALVEHVRGLGLEFGLWVEPEMVNPDSDLYRAHPDWAIAVVGHPEVLARHQLVLDLANPDAFAYLLERLDHLLTEFAIGYVKWDMNRDLLQAQVHRQTVALYALLDELGRRHPEVEIESCSSGGARIDLGILRRTRRVWTSDCNDALERQLIQRGCSYIVPPELMGAHIGPTTSHTTGRVHTLAFRAATAFFGHFGLEWDVSSASDAERDGLAEIIRLHQRFRPLLHTGRVVRGDHPDPAALVHGVVATDGSEAVFAYVQLQTSDPTVPRLVQLPGLDPHRTYRVERLALPGEEAARQKHPPPWYATGLALSGAVLGRSGLALAVHDPESATLLHLLAEQDASVSG